MKPRRHQRRIRIAALIASALVFGAEAWWLVDAVSEAQSARAIVAARVNEIARLQSRDPAPDAVVETQLRARRMQLEAMSAKVAEVRGGSQPAFTSNGREGLEPADVYFRLATYVEDLRNRAVTAGIAVAANERFGFSDYANVGPPTELASVVLRQSAALQSVLNPLLEIRPHEISRVQRSRPKQQGDTGAKSEEQPAVHDSADYFDFDRRHAIDGFGSPHDLMFRVGFVGSASSLRSLLNHYAAAGSTVVVREVDVARSERARRKAGDRDDPAAERLVVDEALCRYSIVTEVVEQAEDIDARGVPGNVSGGRWEAPVSQSRGTEWRFELFSPPRVFRDDSGGFAAEKRLETLPHIAAADTVGLFGLSLLSLETELYRLQLVGFAGEREQLVGVFQDVATGEMLLARAGQRLSQLSAVVVDLRVEFSDVAVLDRENTKLRIGKAVVRDELNGELVQLTTAERRCAREPVARVALDGTSGENRSVRAGDVVEAGHWRFRIDAIRAGESSIVVTREDASGERETRTLRTQPSALAQAETPAH